MTYLFRNSSELIQQGFTTRALRRSLTSSKIGLDPARRDETMTSRHQSGPKSRIEKVPGWAARQRRKVCVV